MLLLHINIVVYACAFWLTHPLLPYLSKELGADRVVFGYLQSSLELAQIVSRWGLGLRRLRRRGLSCLVRGASAKGLAHG